MKLKPLAPLPPPPPPAEEVAPVVVDVTLRPENGMRILTIQLPAFKRVSDEDRRDAEKTRGKAAQAVCDITGALIFDDKNVTTLVNNLRPEFNGKTLSTAFLRELLSKIEESEKASEKAALEKGHNNGARHAAHPSGERGRF